MATLYFGMPREAARMLEDFDGFLLAQEVPWRTRKTLIDTAGRFLRWLEVHKDLGDLARIAGDNGETWDVRESFLVADCRDREVRHDLRPQVNRFLGFVAALACA